MKGRGALAALVLLAIALKLVLLSTSQSMPDGDEAVEGIMAMHILQQGVHPIYPWGVRYGAGAFVETHLAAALFALLGVSGITLKAAGLLVWGATLACVHVTARRCGGARAAWIATALFAWSPQAAQWSMKVGGGHQVGVLVCLLAALSVQNARLDVLTALLLPLAVVAHPIVTPFPVALAAYALFRRTGPQRLHLLALLAVFSAAVAWLLWPTEQGVWDPSARALDLASALRTLPSVVLGFFTANLNSRETPDPLAVGVSLLWLAVFGWSVFRLRRRTALVLLLGAPALALLLVHPTQWAPRHLLLLYPLACIALGLALSDPKLRGAMPIVALLIATGALVQVREIASPNVYGPDPQNAGLSRANVRDVMSALETAGVHHVYCLDPMFQWNITFESRLAILARWQDPLDRHPDFPQQIDEARLRGERIALVAPDRAPDRPPGQRFEVLLDPDPEVVSKLFPLSPRIAPEVRGR